LPKLEEIEEMARRAWPHVVHRVSETAIAIGSVVKRVFPIILHYLVVIVRAIIMLVIQLVTFAIKTIVNIITSSMK
jgi:lipopolysaccharide/colanic/teichoic acid biosynthesis glycosyltransferase